jgi:ubiquinol-cytochrome c reductase cytochrome b subunit
LGGFILFHLFSLHSSGRRNLLTLHTGLDKVSFFPYYWIKDSLNFLGFFCFFIFFCFFPFILGDPEGFVGADPIVSPVHILPE